MSGTENTGNHSSLTKAVEYLVTETENLLASEFQKIDYKISKKDLESMVGKNLNFVIENLKKVDAEVDEGVKLAAKDEIMGKLLI